MTGARRWPLWTTLVPLGVAVLAWFLVWGGWRDRLAETLVALLPPGTPVAMGGFPYRLEARFGPVDMTLRDSVLAARLSARAVEVNRQPWRLDRQVISLVDPDVAVSLESMTYLDARVRSPSALASLRTAGGRVARLSIVWEAPQLELGFLPVPVVARTLELHLRETPAQQAVSGPDLPVQAEAVLSGEGVRFGEGMPVGLSAMFELRASSPVAGVVSWRAGGEVQLRDLVLSDAGGEVMRLSARLLPGPAGGLAATGRIETVCPASVRAALMGAPPVTEKRARKPVVFGFAAEAGGGVALSPPATGPVPVRGQAPDCPRLR